MSATLSLEVHSSDREAWLEERRNGIGASECAAMFGEHPWMSLAKLVAIKRGKLDEDPTNERLEWGQRHERTIREAFGSLRYANRSTREGGWLVRSEKHPWAFATLDAENEHPEHGWIPLELKAIEVWKSGDWEDGPPKNYWWQCQHQMFVTGAPCCSIASLLGVHRLVWCDVDRDAAAQRMIARRGPEVMSLIESGEDPPAPYETETFNALWGEHEPGKIITLSSDLEDLDAERKNLMEVLAKCEERKKIIDDRIRAEMKSAEIGVVEGTSIVYTLRTVRRKGYSVAPFTYRSLHRKSERKEE